MCVVGQLLGWVLGFAWMSKSKSEFPGDSPSREDREAVGPCRAQCKLDLQG